MRVHTLLIYLLFLSVFILPSMARAEYSQEPTKNLQAQTIESANGLTLQTALTLALEANPEISVAIREREAIEGVVTQAGTRPNPSISTSIQDTRRDTRQVFLQLNQEIELGNKREARIEAADAFYNKASAKLESKKAEIHANVVTTFYEVLAGQERLKLSRSSVEVANLALDAASKRVKAGRSSPVEETKSKIAESSAKIEFNQAASQLSSARKRLSALWGNPLPVFESAQGDVENIPSVSSLADLSASLESSPAISLAKLEISARDSMTKIERSKATPNITISAGVLNNQELGGLNQALLGLSVPIPVFDRNQGNLQEAVSRQYKAQDELVAVRAQLLANLATQYERLNSARQTSESLRSEILPGAQSAFDAANKGFNAGKFSFLDVLDAQRTLFQARSIYIQALLDAHQAVAEIERITGNTASSLTAKP
ncbi:MAG: cobalt-zinc-cadmium resistance protein [Methylotenera sp. 17-45-7]|nr:MAG: cobalt-zinc-cadmium resistance protein [Methylotenera sp. 17-45-7]